MKELTVYNMHTAESVKKCAGLRETRGVKKEPSCIKLQTPCLYTGYTYAWDAI